MANIELSRSYFDNDKKDLCIVSVNSAGREIIKRISAKEICISDGIDSEVKVGLPGEELRKTKDMISFRFYEKETKSIREMKLLLLEHNGRDIKIFDLAEENGWFTADLSSLKEMELGQKATQYRLAVLYVQYNEHYIEALYDSEAEVIGQQPEKEFVRTIKELIIDDYAVFANGKEGYIYGYFKDNGRLQVSLCEKSFVVTSRTYCKLDKIEFRKSGKMRLTLIYDEGPLKFSRVVTNFRSKIRADHQEYEFDVCEEGLSEDGSQTKLLVELDLTSCDFRPLYWDIYLLLKETTTNTEYNIPVSVGVYEKTFKSFIYDAGYTWKNGYFIYPYATVGGKLALQYREKSEYDNIFFRLKERVAGGIYKVFKPFWKKKNIYLVYEKFCLMAQDNGYYFFKYCMEHDVEKELGGKILYVMSKKAAAADREKLEEYKDHVIEFMSLKYMIYLLAAKLLISTDTKDHAYAWRRRNSLLAGYVRHKNLVFLQHGVTALKKVDFLYGKGKLGSCDLFVVTSDYEKKIVKKYFGYSDYEIANTGFARWDVLRDHSAGSHEILMMPTWRNWLEDVSEEQFKESDYFKNYMTFLNSPELNTILENHKLTLNFYLHTKFRDYIKDFEIKSKRIKLIPFGSKPLNQLMMRCKMLITDYSSTSWDVFYQGKPVIFYQFDLNTYMEAHGSYMDMTKELFGPRVEDLSSLYEQIDFYARKKFALEDQYAAMREGYFSHIDSNNSKRIVEAIKDMRL